jgi:23S rRNA (cytosine1962-C5)-methyltransferase
LPQWQWLSEITPKGSRVLSLFAHSGAATLALAQAGAEVVHVDSSRQSLQLARRNATASHLDAASIRWICEDAQRFVTRERARGNTYDGFVLDPPSWGHGPKGEAFSIDRHLASLLTDCAQLLSPTAQGPILLTAHSPGWHHQRLATALASVLQAVSCKMLPISSGPLSCMDLDRRQLLLGGFARSSSIGDTSQ